VPSAVFYLVGWVGFLLGLAMILLSRLDIIAQTVWTEYSGFIGSSAEVILFSLGLANSINIEKRRRIEAEESALEKEKQINAKNQKLQALELNKQRLEVDKRLADLEVKIERENLTIAISHELRTPLNAINAVLETVHSESTLEDLVEGIDVIRVGANRLSTQVENVTIMTDLNGGLEPQLRSFTLDYLVCSMQCIADVQLKGKSVVFEIFGVKEIPQWLIGDGYLIVRMLAPVVDNACKYTLEGRVTVRFSYHGGIFSVSIKDTGPGLTVDEQKSIYKPYKQVSSGFKREHEGMGLGLSVASALAKLMLGEINVDCLEDQGCDFTIKVPLAECLASAKLSQHSTKLTTEGAMGISGSILIVEDNPVNATVLAAICKKIGFKTTITENGEQGVEVALKQPFDTILMDLQMPVMDGFEATKKLRQAGISIPIIAVSANTDHNARLRCFTVGMDDSKNKTKRRVVINGFGRIGRLSILNRP